MDAHGHRPFKCPFAAPSTDVHRSPLRCVVYIARSPWYTSTTVTPAVTPTGQIRRLENAVTRANAVAIKAGFDSPQLHLCPQTSADVRGRVSRRNVGAELPTTATTEALRPIALTSMPM